MASARLATQAHRCLGGIGVLAHFATTPLLADDVRPLAEGLTQRRANVGMAVDEAGDEWIAGDSVQQLAGQLMVGKPSLSHNLAMDAPQEALVAAGGKDLVGVELQVVQRHHRVEQIVPGQRVHYVHLLLQDHLTDGPADLLDGHLTLLALLKLAVHHLSQVSKLPYDALLYDERRVALPIASEPHTHRRLHNTAHRSRRDDSRHRGGDGSTLDESRAPHVGDAPQRNKHRSFQSLSFSVRRRSEGLCWCPLLRTPCSACYSRQLDLLSMFGLPPAAAAADGEAAINEPTRLQ